MQSALSIPFQIVRPLYERTSMHRSVIDEIEDTSLRAAYAECRTITRTYAKTFYLATRFLPKHKQRAIFAIYALCRYLDDIVDEYEDLGNKDYLTPGMISERLAICRTELIKSYQGGSEHNKIFVAFSDVLKTFNIDISIPLELIDGVEMDLYKNRYNTFEELYDYCYKVASTVGLMTSEVFGYSGKEALTYAVDLGIAMQLTNIIRDIGEDIDRNRVYIPKTELRQFWVSETDLFSKELSIEMIELLQFQISRARAYYAKAEQGISMLDKDSQLPVWLARFNYARILDKVEDSGYNVLKQRAYLTSREKLSIIPKIWWKMNQSAD